MPFDEQMLKRALEKMEAGINNNARAITNNAKILDSHSHQLAEMRQDQMAKDQVDRAMKVLDQMTTRGAQQVNVIIAAGYVGFLTLWSTLKSDMPLWLYATIGLLLVLSMLIYVGWEVGQVLHRTIKALGVQKDLSGEPPHMTFDRFQERMKLVERASMRLWPWAVSSALLTGVPAGMLLLGFFVYRTIL